VKHDTCYDNVAAPQNSELILKSIILSSAITGLCTGDAPAAGSRTQRRRQLSLTLDKHIDQLPAVANRRVDCQVLSERRKPVATERIWPS
jgi:hypothetical protein